MGDGYIVLQIQSTKIKYFYAFPMEIVSVRLIILIFSISAKRTKREEQSSCASVVLTVVVEVTMPPAPCTAVHRSVCAREAIDCAQY